MTGAFGTDPDAFERLYRAHVRDVTYFVARRVLDPYLTADLTAEVFLRAVEAAAGYRGGPGGPRAWLFGIARNIVAEQRRAAARQQRFEARLAGRRLLDDDDVARIEERIDAARSAAGLPLDALPDGERAVLELVALDGLSVAEAAGVLGIRAGTARVRLYRARWRPTAEIVKRGTGRQRRQAVESRGNVRRRLRRWAGGLCR